MQAIDFLCNNGMGAGKSCEFPFAQRCGRWISCGTMFFSWTIWYQPSMWEELSHHTYVLVLLSKAFFRLINFAHKTNRISDPLFLILRSMEHFNCHYLNATCHPRVLGQYVFWWTLHDLLLCGADNAGEQLYGIGYMLMDSKLNYRFLL